jgi:enediyne biosynthesis protein E4
MSVVRLRKNWIRLPSSLRMPLRRISLVSLLTACCGAVGCSSQSEIQSAPAPSLPETKTIEAVAGSTVPVSEHYQFTSVLADSGIDFRHESGDSPLKAFPAANGSGIGLVDFDHDGWYDLLFLTNNAFEPGQPPTQSNRCYRNLGSMSFVDVTAHCGLGHAGYSAGVAIGDYNSDGFADAYVTCYGENQLYQNRGDGTFQNVSQTSGTADPRWGASAAFLDIDGDGLLDLYSGNYAKWTPEENAFCGDHKRKVRMYCSPKSVQPDQDVLYRNAGDGTFADVSESFGILTKSGRTQGVLAADLTDDGHTDLYVTNDLNPNTLWINQGNGHLTDTAQIAGVAYDFNGVAQAGMGVAAADANRDGLLDLFVTNFEGEHNTYYEQDANGFFSDISHMRGLAAASIPWIGWGTALSDFDLDGWPDVFVINGHTDNNLHEMGREGEYAQPSLFWRNERGQFTHVMPKDSPFFHQLHPGRGLCRGDLDNDLDWDVVCQQQDLPPDILRNDSPHHVDTMVIQLQLVGTDTNRDAIGAAVRCRMGDRTILEQVMNGGSYLCANDPRLALVIPKPESDSPIKLEIRWGEHSRSQVEIPPVSGRILIRDSQFFRMR